MGMKLDKNQKRDTSTISCDCTFDHFLNTAFLENKKKNLNCWFTETAHRHSEQMAQEQIYHIVCIWLGFNVHFPVLMRV